MLELRVAGPEELHSVRDAFRAVVEPLEVYNEEARRCELERYTVSYFQELLQADPRNVVVAVDGGAVQGFAITRHDDGLLWLCWYGVVPAARGRGLWRPLLERVIELARERGYWKIWCDARSENIHSIVRLEQLGFRVVCTLERHWHGQDYVLMERWP
jgi:ribosomal protein S18 acetylase RimI-like enzyme